MPEPAASEAPSFPMTRECPFSEPAAYRQLREQGRLGRGQLPDGRGVRVLTRHEDIRAMLADPRFGSDRANPGFPQQVERPKKNQFPKMMISMDGAEHTAARRAVLGEFTVRRTNALLPRIQQIVDQHIETMLAGPPRGDLVRELSLPVPSLVICELLGVPYADHEFFQQHSATLLNREVSGEQRGAAVGALRSYLDGLVRRKMELPTDDLLGRQIRQQRESGAADVDGLVSTAVLLLIAGHETTANMISLGTLMLLENPERLAAITADPGKTPGAVEELLRYFTIAEFATSRVALEDVEIGGSLIEAGEGVIGLALSANRDAEVFDRPEELDVERGARNHLAFGFGPHQCLGQNLARAELRIVFDTLFRRIPGLRLDAEVSQLPFKNDASVFGLHRLPVAW